MKIIGLKYKTSSKISIYWNWASIFNKQQNNHGELIIEECYGELGKNERKNCNA